MRRQRAEEEQREGEALGERVQADRERAVADRARLEDEVREAADGARVVAPRRKKRRAAPSPRCGRASRWPTGSRARAAISCAASRSIAKAPRESSTKSSSAQQRWSRSVRRSPTPRESVAREVSAADEAVELAKSAVEQAEAALAEARAAMNAAKENEASARHELFRADEALHRAAGQGARPRVARARARGTGAGRSATAARARAIR